jgi:O-antigen/teichoic acid export membrane protein
MQVGLKLILQAALSPLVLYVAGQEALGAYAILLQATAFLALVDFGFGSALSRYLAQASGYEDSKKRFLMIFSIGRTFYALSNLFFALLVVIFSFFIGRIFSFSTVIESQARIGLWILAGWSVLRIPFAVYGPALTATQNMAANNFINMGSNFVRIVISLGMLFWGFGLVGLMLGNVMAEAFNYILQRWYYSRRYPDEKIGWGISNWKLFKEMIAFSGGYVLVIIGGKLSLSTDNLIVGALFGGAATSVYYTTQIPTFFLVALIWKIVDNSTPGINELYGKGSIERMQTVYLRLYRYSLLCALGLAFGLIAFNRETIILWVGQQQYAGSLMNISLVLFVIASVISHINAVIMIAYGSVHFLSALCISAGVAI